MATAGLDRWGPRCAAAVAAIDAANAEDPVRVVAAGVERPKELVHAEAMTAWVLRLDPGATEVQVLAARAHHLRRWVWPRTDFPEGRAGYLRWRAAQKRRHAAEVADILSGCGYDEAEIERVGQIIRKDGLGEDPQVQVHEDALCLVFLELQAAEVAADLGEAKALDVLAKTARKMSPRALVEARSLDVAPAVHDLLERAVADPA